jgi:hypothetical protein
MNEIILTPCDVISKIKQNSSDMNEIILAPCDAGYVQSCTGFLIFLKQNTIWLKTGNNRFNLTFFLNRNIYLILLTLFKFVDSVRYAVNHR